MENNLNEIDKYDVVKHIGKGSFSNVYLCKQDLPLFLNESNELNELNQEFFIIKEININELVKKYVKNTNGKSTNIKKTNVKNTNTNYKHKKNGPSSLEVNITPYAERKIQESKTLEMEYYYKRLEELIESEIEILKMLDHKNIIKFYGYTKKNGIYYLRMEYCDGGDVYEYLKNGNNMENRNVFNGFSNKFLYDFLKQTTDGLFYLHGRNIIHRDIKLHNVLMKTVKGEIVFKISDFGFACFDMSNENFLDDDNDILSKKYYKLCGTPYYMAPEIILNMNKMENITSYRMNRKKYEIFYNKKIDMWSYGICIYELIFNILPFSNIKTINDLEILFSLENIQDILNKKIVDKTSIGNNIKQLLMFLLQIDILQRYSINEVKQFIMEKIGEVEVVFMNKANLTDIINCNENIYKKNETMKEHIIRQPINIDENIESWEKINKSSSLIMKMSIKKGFLNWLIN